MPGPHRMAWIIRSCRESRGYSQEYMADMLDIGQSAYANIESGKTKISIDRLIQISEILKVSIHELIDSGCYQTEIKESLGLQLITSHHSTYDELIRELRNEIDFLKILVLNQRSDSSPISDSPKGDQHS